MDNTQYPIVRGAVQLPAGSEIITDVDEEVTSLYTLEMSILSTKRHLHTTRSSSCIPTCNLLVATPNRLVFVA